MTGDVRRIDDPQSLRALAHPLRLRILEVLTVRGSATATQLGEALGESSGSTSYHLRMLASYGFIEDAPDEGVGRERYWRRASRGISFGAVGDPALVDASRGLRLQLLHRHRHHVERYLDHEDELSTVWQDAADFSDDLVHVTADELREITAAVHELLAGYRRDDAADRPAGALPVLVTTYALPGGLHDAGTA